MGISIFDVIGPVMIGPSSSHTAGAARLARTAAAIIGRPFHQVVFGLYGSFAKTHQGHGTDIALLAGVLGIHEDDEMMVYAQDIAAEKGLAYSYEEVDLNGVHENSVLFTFNCDDGTTHRIIGSSVGGGQIEICKINEFDTEFSANASTLMIHHQDVKGMISHITAILSAAGINIAVMKLSRESKGEDAFCIIETDDVISPQVTELLKILDGVSYVQALNKLD